jgi:hypothetical protein
MSAFENARKFSETCETPVGWAGCKEYGADSASLNVQSKPHGLWRITHHIWDGLPQDN